MKFAAIGAMAIAGIDCMEKAAGVQHQKLFDAGHIWMWWIFAAVWFVNALCMCFAKVEYL